MIDVYTYFAIFKKDVFKQTEVFRYLNGRLDQHRDDAHLRCRSVGQPVRDGDDKCVRASSIFTSLHMVARELGVPHEEEQARYCREDSSVGIGQRERGRGTRGGETNRGDRGQVQQDDSYRYVQRDFQKSAEQKSLSNRHDTPEQSDHDGSGADTHVSVIHL